jgi:hypothetical protein
MVEVKEGRIVQVLLTSLAGRSEGIDPGAAQAPGRGGIFSTAGKNRM